MPSSSTASIILCLALFSLLSTTSQASPCSDLFRRMATQRAQKNYTHCKMLNTLGAEFAWNLCNDNDSRVDIFFGARLERESGWLAWGVNPGKSPQMVGTRALIGIVQPDGSAVVNTYNITSDTKLGCRLLPSKIEVQVLKPQVTFSKGYQAIWATLILPREYNISRLNHVWQVGYLAEGLQPKIHPTKLQNVDSTERINLKDESSQGIGQHRRHLRVVHGILNIVGWGTLLPIGAIIARYFRKFPVRYEKWDVLHVCCQIFGYTLGTVGWIIGLWLGYASKHYYFPIHRMLAIFIFTFTSLQMLALRLRPKDNDEYRKYWDMYHHFLGYALIAVISVNIFHGIAILRPDYSWRGPYLGVLGMLAVITVGLEIFTWAKFITLRKKDKKQRDATRNAAQQAQSQQEPIQSGPSQPVDAPRPDQTQSSVFRPIEGYTPPPDQTPRSEGLTAQSSIISPVEGYTPPPDPTQRRERHATQDNAIHAVPVEGYALPPGPTQRPRGHSAQRNAIRPVVGYTTPPHPTQGPE